MSNKESVVTTADCVIDNYEKDQENGVIQQGLPTANENFHDTESSMFNRLKETLVRIFLPRCFVYPFVAVVVAVVAVVMIVEYAKGDNTEIPHIIIDDHYTDNGNATSAPTAVNVSFESPQPSATPT